MLYSKELIIEIFYTLQDLVKGHYINYMLSHIVDIVTFDQMLESVCDRKLRETHSNISARS